MNKKVKIIVLSVLAFLIVGLGLRYVLDKTYLSDYIRHGLRGSDRYESMVIINQERWKKSKEAVLSNIYSTTDNISVAPFAYQKNIPMYFSESFELNDTIKKEFKRLGLEKLYIIGGEGNINKSVEESINKMGIKTERIYGKHSFETSIKLATRLTELTDVKEIAVANDGEGVPNGVAMASPASKNNIPIIMMNKKDTNALLKFINENNIEKVYVIGNEEQFSKDFMKKMPNSKRIIGKNRYETDIMIIKEFYDLEKVKNVYMTKGGKDNNIDFINTLCLSTIAAKEDKPIVFNDASMPKEVKKFLKDNNIKEFTEVGFKLVRPRLINPTTTRVFTCLLIIVIWIVGIKRVISFH